jgi:hypothetical protein
MGSISVFRFVCLMFLVTWITEVEAGNGVFDVTKYGAVADAKTDNSKVILAISKYAIRPAFLKIINLFTYSNRTLLPVARKYDFFFKKKNVITWIVLYCVFAGF